MTPTPIRTAASGALSILGVMVAAGCGGSDDTASTTIVEPTGIECPVADDCTTSQLAESSGVLLGAAVTVSHLSESGYADTLATGFNSVTPENELKWAAVHPEPDVWNFGPVDTLVEFAEHHDMAVKGHTLIWDQEIIDSTPEWVLSIDDPDDLRTVVTEHFTTLMERYDGSIDRWDVVNEPLQTVGAEIYQNHFFEVLGPDYIAEMFEIAHRADPDARLFLNEATVEYIPAKAAALLALVTDLVDRGVPIDGVGLQVHLLGGVPEPGVISGLIVDLQAVGLEVALTELDVPIDPVNDRGQALATQADAYGQAVEECLAAGCREVTVWGFTDRYTWIDDMLGADRDPLPYDEDYAPKPAVDAVREQLIEIS